VQIQIKQIKSEDSSVYICVNVSQFLF
jgi:hypothetical protein